jgi:hypothetical protein
LRRQPTFLRRQPTAGVLAPLRAFARALRGANSRDYVAYRLVNSFV